MKKMLMAIVLIMAAAAMCYAAEDAAPKATEPIGAVLETGGVIIGKMTSVIEKSLGGGKTEGSLVMAEDNGKTKIIPLDYSVKALDSGFHIVTLNQLKGRKVSVEVSKGKATKVQEIQ